MLYASYWLFRRRCCFDETFICLNGFNNYNGGHNQYTDEDNVALFNENIVINQNQINYLNVFFLSIGNYDVDNQTTVTPLDITSEGVYKIPITSNLVEINQDEIGTIFKIKSNDVCEPKYTPITCYFINRYGAGNLLLFLKLK